MNKFDFISGVYYNKYNNWSRLNVNHKRAF